MIVLFFDGLCEPVNPGGVACGGFVAYLDGARLTAGSKCFGAGYLGDHTSNNVAEYLALIEGLKQLLALGYVSHCLAVKGDSQLVVKQLRGEYRVRSERLRPLYEEACRLLAHFPSYVVEWVPRELNAEADALSREAYRRFVQAHPEALSFYRKLRHSKPPKLR